MSNLKYLAKLIVNIKAIRTFIIFLLRRNLIFKKFKNLIKLDGFKTIYKYQIEIFNDKKDAVSRDLCIFGIPKSEKEIFKFFKTEIEKAESFLDIGAGIGLYTLFAISFNSSVSILSVEANPEVFNVLKKNVTNLSSFGTNQKFLNKVVSTSDCNLDFYVPLGDDFSYGSSKKALLEQKNIPYKKVNVETSDLTDFIDCKYEIIKIDVEGGELDVLIAISKHLKHCRLLFIEIMIENKDASLELLSSFDFIPLIESTQEVGNYIFYNKNL